MWKQRSHPSHSICRSVSSSQPQISHGFSSSAGSCGLSGCDDEPGASPRSRADGGRASRSASPLSRSLRLRRSPPISACAARSSLLFLLRGRPRFFFGRSADASAGDGAPGLSPAASARRDGLVRLSGTATSSSSFGARPRSVPRAFGLAGRFSGLDAAAPSVTPLQSSSPASSGAAAVAASSPATSAPASASPGAAASSAGAASATTASAPGASSTAGISTSFSKAASFALSGGGTPSPAAPAPSAALPSAIGSSVGSSGTPVAEPSAAASEAAAASCAPGAVAPSAPASAPVAGAASAPRTSGASSTCIASPAPAAASSAAGALPARLEGSMISSQDCSSSSAIRARFRTPPSSSGSSSIPCPWSYAPGST